MIETVFPLLSVLTIAISQMKLVVLDIISWQRASREYQSNSTRVSQSVSCEYQNFFLDFF